MATRTLERTLLPETEVEVLAPRRRRPAPVVALTVLTVLVAAELGARALASRLPVPSGWNQGQIAVSVERMRTVAATEGGTDVVFLGSSAASFDLDPEALHRATGARAFNASLVGASAVSLERWSSEFVLPHLRPRVAVIGLTSRDLNFAEIQRYYFEGYLNSPPRKHAVGIESSAERIERALAERSALVRLRQYLRKPGSVAKHIRGTGTLEEFLELGPHGEALFPEADFDFREVAQQAQWNREALDGFSMDQGIAALVRTAEEFRANGTRVVFVETPVVEDLYLPYHPRGRADFEAFRTAFASLGEDLDVPLIRASGRWKRERWFVDAIHLNRAGARRFTTQVAHELQRLGLV